MKNTVYTYDKFVRYDYEVADYTSRFYGSISKFFRQYSNYFEVYKLEDDEKLENVSYKLFNTTDYADLILAINEDTFLWNVPYNQDINAEQTKLLAKVLLNSADLVNMNTLEKDRVSEMAKDSIDRLNEYKRTILVPKNEYLSTIIGLVEKYRELYNLNVELSEDDARARIGDLV